MALRKWRVISPGVNGSSVNCMRANSVSAHSLVPLDTQVQFHTGTAAAERRDTSTIGSASRPFSEIDARSKTKNSLAALHLNCTTVLGRIWLHWE